MSTGAARPPLSAAIGRYPHSAALFTDPALSIEPFPVISRAFKPMVREERFDISEMAIATFLQARAHGSTLVLLPVTMAARFQNAAMLRLASNPFGPADLRGKHIGVRAYSQTTGLWLRGDIQETTGLDPAAMHWITFEDAHVAGVQDPPFASRAPAGSDMLAMLRDGTLDAAIFGNDTPSAPDLATVFPDPDQAARSFYARHHLVPVNHLLVARADIAAQPGTIRALLDRVPAPEAAGPRAPAGIEGANLLPRGRAALDPAIQLAIEYSVQQGLIPRALTLEEVWAGLPPDCAA